jgi:hypothetical protein
MSEQKDWTHGSTPYSEDAALAEMRRLATERDEARAATKALVKYGDAADAESDRWRKLAEQLARHVGKRTCNRCNGMGALMMMGQWTGKCPDCNGAGLSPEARTALADFDRAVEDSTR